MPNHSPGYYKAHPGLPLEWRLSVQNVFSPPFLLYEPYTRPDEPYTRPDRRAMQHEESKSFQGVADCDLINARLRGAARRSRAVANRLRKLQSDDVVDLQDLQPDNLGSETELDAREVQGEGQDPGELEAGSIMVNDAAAAATSVAAAASSGAVAGPDNRDDAANFGTGDAVGPDDRDDAANG